MELFGSRVLYDQIRNRTVRDTDGVVRRMPSREVLCYPRRASLGSWVCMPSRWASSDQCTIRSGNESCWRVDILVLQSRRLSIVERAILICNI